MLEIKTANNKLVVRTEESYQLLQFGSVSLVSKQPNEIQGCVLRDNRLYNKHDSAC